MNHQTLYLPVEIKHRELLGKALLACIAAEAGHTSFLGEQNELFDVIDRLPPGIYLEKVLTRAQARRLRRFRDLGLYLAGWDEEGLVYRNADLYLNDRIAAASFGLLRQFFAWGEVQRADVGGRFPGAALSATGNPRFDLLRPEFRGLFAAEAQSFRNRYGRYILVNTNFGRINHLEGHDYVVQLRQARGTVGTTENQARALRLDNYVRQNLEGLLAALPALEAALPDHTIIVRPHPSENIATWQEAARGLARTEVISQGSALPWILGAEAIVHNSCTTAVEAFMLEVPRVAYRPYREDEFETELPNLVSASAENPAQLTAALQALAGQGRQSLSPEASQTIGRYISARDGALASDNILAALAAVEAPRRGLGRSVVNRLGGLAIRASRPLRRALNATAQSEAYSRQKFDHLRAAEMTGIVENLQAACGRFGGVAVNPVPGTTTCYRIARTGE